MFTMILLVLMALFYAGIKRGSVSFHKNPFLSHVQVISYAIFPFCRLKYAYNCFISTFLFSRFCGLLSAPYHDFVLKTIEVDVPVLVFVEFGLYHNQWIMLIKYVNINCKNSTLRKRRCVLLNGSRCKKRNQQPSSNVGGGGFYLAPLRKV